MQEKVPHVPMRCVLFPGSSRYRIMPLHSQIPREEQRRVFEPVPDNIRKVGP